MVWIALLRYFIALSSSLIHPASGVLSLLGFFHRHFIYESYGAPQSRQCCSVRETTRPQRATDNQPVITAYQFTHQETR